MPGLFSPFTLQSPRGGVALANRIVIAPMCQYMVENGEAADWHLAHWTSLLNSGAGLITIEATAVTPEGRISPGCLGLWDDRTEQAFGNKLHRARALAPRVPISLQVPTLSVSIVFLKLTFIFFYISLYFSSLFFLFNLLFHKKIPTSL